jgi:general secretion pathway protein A
VQKFAEQASVRCELEPLAEDEVGGYVLHRLAVAGTNARIDFDDSAVERLNHLSRGVPRVINLLCDHALKLGHDASASVINRAMIDRAADDLNIETPKTRVSRLARGVIRGVMTIAALALLMLVGAGAAAFVFQDRLAQVIARWEAIPAPPRPPVLRQPAPLVPRPPPPTERPDTPPPKPRG